MASNVPTSSNASTSSNVPCPWMTREAMVITRCWMRVYKGVTPMVPLHFLVGDEWTRITGFFIHEMGQGQHRVKTDIVNKLRDLKEKIAWFNRWYHYIKTNNYYFSDDEELLEVVKEHYIFERDGSEFEYEDAWNLVKSN